MKRCLLHRLLQDTEVVEEEEEEEGCRTPLRRRSYPPGENFVLVPRRLIFC